MRRPTWPEVRAALLAFHVVAVALLAIPGAGLRSTKGLRSRTLQADVADYAARLGMTPAELTGVIESVAAKALVVQRGLAPFELYAQVTGAKQGWAMFASPQRHPSEVHVEGRGADGRWVFLYRPHDPEATFMGGFMRHNRVRKFTGRFARAARRSNYDGLAAHLARRACMEKEELAEVRVSLWSYPALDRAAVERGERPRGHRERPSLHDCAAVRRSLAHGTTP